MLKRVRCTACIDVPGHQKIFCGECHGAGYTEHRDYDPSCTRRYPECPIEYEPSVNGWLCTKCGDSGRT